ncbi:MAG: flagellar motor switch protein FliM, partial [Burkholderiales bacterium 21-58-4]
MPYQSFLSQDEVDALLAGVAGDSNAPSSQPIDPDSVRLYDLSSPDRVVRHRMQTLELINERFARRLRSVLLSFMRRSADITVGPIRVQKYSDFERNLPIPSNLNMVMMKPLRGVSLFTFDPNLIFLIIDSLFGGHGRYNMRVEGRDFTSTEQRIIRRLLNLTLDSCKHAWESIYPIEFEYVRSEMHTKFASIAGNNEIVFVSSFNIEFGAAGGTLNICVPYSTIEPIRDVLTRPLQDASTDSIDQR